MIGAALAVGVTPGEISVTISLAPASTSRHERLMGVGRVAGAHRILAGFTHEVSDSCLWSANGALSPNEDGHRRVVIDLLKYI